MTEDVSGLVERLRARKIPVYVPDVQGDEWQDDPLCIEAADALASLSQRLAARDSALRLVNEKWEAAIDERDANIMARNDFCRDAEALRVERDAAREENERLRKAVLPAYMGLLVLKTMCRKAGLVIGVEATEDAMESLVAEMPELPSLSALRSSATLSTPSKEEKSDAEN